MVQECKRFYMISRQWIYSTQPTGVQYFTSGLFLYLSIAKLMIAQLHGG